MSQKNTHDPKTNLSQSLFLIVFLVVGFILGCVCSTLLLTQQYTTDLNDFAYYNYQHFIQKEGAANIAQMVKQADSISPPDQKLNALANLEVSNFTDIFWFESSDELFENKCSGVPLLNHRYFGNDCNGIGFDKNGALRIRRGNLTNNPYWIAYYKTGACGELATLFANVTNQSGFVTRVVYSSDPDHAWTEVYLNGTWYYFDPDMYHSLNGEKKNQKYWFDTTDTFEDKLGWKFSRVSVDNSTQDGYEEDRTQYYTKTGLVKLVLNKPIERIVVRVENSNSYVWTFKPNCISYPCTYESHLGSGKKYVIQIYSSTIAWFFTCNTFWMNENTTQVIGVDFPVRFNGTVELPLKKNLTISYF